MRGVRGVVHVVGELMITAGVFLLAFLVWQLWWTDVTAGHAQAQQVTQLEQQFAQPQKGGTDASVHPSAKLGDAFALMRVPRFGSDYVMPVHEGTTTDILQEGIGHYVGTAAPGKVGNFATAGHRTTYGKPYSDIAELKDGDVVVVETKKAYYVYDVVSHEIVLPTDVAVIAPVPDKPGAVPTDAMLTMTSCNPRYSAVQRYVVHAKLAKTYARAQGLPTSVLAAPKGA